MRILNDKIQSGVIVGLAMIFFSVTFAPVLVRTTHTIYHFYTETLHLHTGGPGSHFSLARTHTHTGGLDHGHSHGMLLDTALQTVKESSEEERKLHTAVLCFYRLFTFYEQVPTIDDHAGNHQAATLTVHNDRYAGRMPPKPLTPPPRQSVLSPHS